MAELTFIYNQMPTVILCSEKDLFKTAVEKFANKVLINPSNLHFLYGGTLKINLNQTIEEIFKKELKTKKKIQILVISNEEELPQNNFKISKEIICPQCFLPCLIKFNGYKIAFSCCKNNHTVKDVLLSDYKNKQKIDESKIICDICKKQNKAKTYENQFYRCLTCKKNICPLCKSAHNIEHEIINYDLCNFVCLIHNEKFNSFCKECKINLCMECESEHIDKQNLIYFRDILPNKNKLKQNLKELKTKIEKYKVKINEIKKSLDNAIINLENYYEINDNLMKEFDAKKKNYYLFKNINEIDKNNNFIIGEINNLIQNDELNHLINNYVNITSKMDIRYKGKNNNSFRENIGIINNFENKIDNYCNDNNFGLINNQMGQQNQNQMNNQMNQMGQQNQNQMNNQMDQGQQYQNQMNNQMNQGQQNQYQMNNLMNQMGQQNQNQMNNQMDLIIKQQMKQQILQEQPKMVQMQSNLSQQNKIFQVGNMLGSDPEDEVWLRGFQLGVEEVNENEEWMRGFQEVKGITVIFRASPNPKPPIYIQCMFDDKVSSIIEKYRKKANDYSHTKKYIFNAKELNPLLSIAEAGLTNNANVFVEETKESKKKFIKKRK